MTLETLEEALETLKEIDEHVLACIHIFRSLRGAGFMIIYIKEIGKGTHREKDTNASKYHICGRECLISDDQITDRRVGELRLTRPTP